MRLGQRSAIAFGSEMLTSIIGFAATVYFARELGADVLGVYFVFIATIIWLRIFSVMGLGSALIRHLSGTDEAGEYLAAGALVQLGALSVIVVGLFAGRRYVTSYLRGVSVEVIVTILVATVALSFVTTVLEGENRVALASFLGPIERLFRSVLQVGAIVAGFSLTGLLFGYGVGALVTVLAGTVFVTTRIRRPRREHFTKLFSFARYSWLNTLGSRAFASLDTIVLGVFVAEGLIGVYEISWNLASILAVFGTSISRVMFPSMSRLSNQDEKAMIGSLLEDSLQYTGLFFIPGLVGGVLMGERVLGIYGPEFVQGYQILLLLTLARGVQAYKVQFVTALNALDLPNMSFRINGVFLAVNICLNVTLIYFYGWYGAAVATLVSAVVALMYGYVLTTAQVSFRFPVVELSKQVGAAGVMGGCVSLVLSVAADGFVWTILLVTLGAVAYMITLMTISPDFRGTVLTNLNIS